jgi:two-component system sensor histidine kinase KdpD
MLCGSYFVMALVLGQLTARVRAQERTLRRQEAHASAVSQLTERLAEASGPGEVLRQAVEQFEEAFDATALLLVREGANEPGKPVQAAGGWKLTSSDERTVAWVFEHGEPAGKSTSRHPLAAALYVPVETAGGTEAVIGLKFRQAPPPSPQQWSLLNAFTERIGAAVDRARLRAQCGVPKFVAKSERLSKLLVLSASQELGIPVVVDEGGAPVLAAPDMVELTEPQRERLETIRQGAQRLHELTGKVLKAG